MNDRAGPDRGRTAQEACRVSSGRGDAKLGANFARERAVGCNDTGLDFDLLRPAVELADEVVEHRQGARNVANDERVGTIVGNDIAARREKLLERTRKVGRLRVAQHASRGNDVGGFGLCLGEIAALFRLFLQGGPRRDTQDVSIQLLIEIVVLEDDVEGLIPWHVVQNDSQRSLHIRIQHDV